jgi:N-acetyl-gamma-glutamyl-phosphate reductase
MSKTCSVAILGASGYTGAELVRFVAGHPSLRISALTGHAKAGLPMGEVWPHLAHLGLPDLVRIEEVDFASVDLAFCALPHATSQSVIKNLPGDLKVVDLSADFRLRDVAAYEKWYGKPHSAPDLQAEAVYGLTEVYREQVAAARLVAGTGCNAMTGLFMLRPLVAARAVDLGDIQLDLKCGPSGAGRSLKENLLYAELAEGSSAYAVGGTHRHLGEFDQELTLAAGQEVRIGFQPHLVPMNRGILATGYVKGDPRAVHAALSETYLGERFVDVLPFGAVPATHHVRGSNRCVIGVAGDRRPGRAVVVGALDNLAKGSSGQAVQNANLMLGLPEAAGLDLVPMFP